MDILVRTTNFKVGDLVCLGESPWAKQRVNSYPGIFKVKAVDGGTLILEFYQNNLERDIPGEVVHFGSTPHAWVNANHFVLYEE